MSAVLHRLKELASQAWMERLFVGMLLGSFLCLALMKIGFHPAPWKDEAWLMQPAFELANNGRMALPMFRHVGGGVGERIYTDPVFSAALAFWFKLFGFGMTTARVFNLLCSLLVLGLVYAMGRRFAVLAGVVAIVLLVLDNNFFTTARFLRNDLLCLLWCVSSSYVYLRHKNSRGLFIAGLLASLGVLTHLNGIYQVGLLGLWTLLDYGPFFFKDRRPWVLAAGLMLVSAPYAATVYLHRDEYLAQWRVFSKGRARGLEAEGLRKNLIEEYRRYRDWKHGVMVMTDNRAVIFFQALTVVSMIYLLALCVRKRLTRAPSDERLHILIAVIWIPLFFALEVSNKTHSYLPHLTVWFALACGVFVRDVFQYGRARRDRLGKALRATVVGLSLVYLSVATILPLKYLKYVRTLEPSAYNLFVSRVRQLPEGYTPVASPRHWYLFSDDTSFRAFSRSLSRKILAGDFSQERFALIVNKREERKLLAVGAESNRLRLWRELDSPYGPMKIYLYD